MKILGFIKSSTVDFPKKIVATIFLGGCNIDCIYCHNQRLIDNEGIEVIKEADLLKFLLKRKKILDGICISGGEATLHKVKLLNFLKKIKDSVGSDFLIKLDTNGSNPEILELAKDYVDYVAIDYKGLDAEKLLGLKEYKYMRSLEVVKGNYMDYEVRITMYPDYIPRADIPSIIEKLEGIKRIYLQQYKPVEGAKQSTYTYEELLEVKRAFVEAGMECEVRC